MSSQQQALRRMLKLVNSLLSRPDAIPFSEPVDWRGLELWDYPKIIKKMMDLGTVKRKLERGVYKTHEECAQDIRLIWSNCQLYNEAESDLWNLAKLYSKKFEDRYKKIVAEFGDSMDDVPASFSGKPSMDVKSKFAEGIFRLNGTELGHVIQTIELQCPEALETVKNTTTAQVEINVDKLPTSTFNELDMYLQERVPNTKRRKVNA